jgi:hypothetical protein
MRAHLPLPQVVELGVRIGSDRTTCELDVFTAEDPTRDDAESTRRAFAPTLCETFQDVQLRLERGPATAAAKDPPQLDYGDPLVRFVLATVISVAHRPRLLSYAERCMARMPRELVVESEDLLEMVLVLLLAGKPKWRGWTGIPRRTSPRSRAGRRRRCGASFTGPSLRFRRRSNPTRPRVHRSNGDRS